MEHIEALVQLKDSFQWQTGSTFLSDPVLVAALLVGYIGLSFAIQFAMRNREPLKVTGVNPLCCVESSGHARQGLWWCTMRGCAWLPLPCARVRCMSSTVLPNTIPTTSYTACSAIPITAFLEPKLPWSSGLTCITCPSFGRFAFFFAFFFAAELID